MTGGYILGVPDPQPKPVEYDYEFYENTFYNDPYGHLVTDRPLLEFRVGDYLNSEINDHIALEKSTEEVLQIAAVWHIISDFGSEVTHHRLAVCVKRVPLPEVFR
jgi:hypothetical protein